jgi:hypothetical protein
MDQRLLDSPSKETWQERVVGFWRRKLGKEGAVDVRASRGIVLSFEDEEVATLARVTVCLLSL